MTDHDHMFTEAGWNAKCVHCRRPRSELVGDALASPVVVNKADIAKDLRAKVADLNEAIEQAAMCGIIVLADIHMQLFHKSGQVHDVPALRLKCVIEC